MTDEERPGPPCYCGRCGCIETFLPGRQAPWADSRLNLLACVNRVIFRGADAVLITKADLLPFIDDFSPESAAEAVRALANTAPITLLSAKSGEGLEAWLDWLRDKLDKRAPADPPQTQHHHHHHHSHG